MARSVLDVLRSKAWSVFLLAAPLLEVSFSCRFFEFVLRFAVMVVAIRCCLLCFVGVGPVSRDPCMNWARVYLRNAPVHALGPGLGQAEA